MDSMKVALANMCDLIDRQLELLVDEKPFVGVQRVVLRPRVAEPDPAVGGDPSRGGVYHGFTGMQLVCSAMTAVRGRVRLSGSCARTWPFLDHDRYMDQDIASVVDLIQSRTLSAVVRSA
jgi:histidine ammonia-lyase